MPMEDTNSMYEKISTLLVPKIIKTDNKIVKNGILINTKSNLGTILINVP